MTPADAAAPGPDVLMHSLGALAPVIVPALELAGARRVVEVGVESGGMTGYLLEYVARVGGECTGIDPFPSDGAREAYAADPRCTLVEGRSPQALAELPAADAYLIDGDHNYWTVTQELRTIARAAGDGGHPLVFLHDVGWPAGRRDQYYEPAAIPDDAVHPFTFTQGVRLGCPGTVDGGFRGEGAFAWALHEGGPANGVRTAIEDFLADAPRYRFAVVPSVFGLGVVSTIDAPYAAALDAHLAPWVDNPVLAATERNRLELYDRVLSLQDVLVANTGDGGARLRAENARLRAELAELGERLAAIRAEAEAMGYLKALRAVDLVERPARRMRRGASLRARIAEIGSMADNASGHSAA
jgi:hypothetical protein